MLGAEGPLFTPAGPTRADRFALRVMQIGAVAVVLAASTYKVFELDRYFVPKELALHLSALIAGLLAVRAFAGRLSPGWICCSSPTCFSARSPP